MIDVSDDRAGSDLTECRVYRENCYVAGGRARKVGYNDIVVAGVGQLHVQQSESGIGLSWQVQLVEAPLVRKRRKGSGAYPQHEVSPYGCGKVGVGMFGIHGGLRLAAQSKTA